MGCPSQLKTCCIGTRKRLENGRGGYHGARPNPVIGQFFAAQPPPNPRPWPRGEKTRTSANGSGALRSIHVCGIPKRLSVLYRTAYPGPLFPDVFEFEDAVRQRCSEFEGASPILHPLRTARSRRSLRRSP